MSVNGTPSEQRGVLLTLDRGLRVLEEIATQQGDATAKNLSEKLGINLATCYQILKTLVVNRYVTRMPGGRYGLGAGVALLMGHYESVTSPPPQLIAVLRDLHARTGESVYVSLRSGTSVRIAAYFEGTKAVRVAALHIGYSDHPHARASGKCFLAYLDPRELEAFVRKEDLERLTPTTITDWSELVAELERIRVQGHAVDAEEFSPGVACVGSILLGAGGVPLGAFGLSAPVATFEERRDAIVATVVEAGRDGSRVLGYEGVYPPLQG